MGASRVLVLPCWLLARSCRALAGNGSVDELGISTGWIFL